MSEQDRKVLRVRFSAWAFFPIPTGLDLEDKTIVESYVVKWDKLYVSLKNGKKLEIKAAHQSEVDYKYPDDDAGEILYQEDTHIRDNDFEIVDELMKK